MKELESRIYEAGERWRFDHTELKENKKTGEVVEKIPLPGPYIIAKELSELVLFTFISKNELPDKSPLYLYNLDDGIYFSSDDYFNLLCRKFDSRVDPKKWAQVKAMVRTLTNIRRPLESPELVPVANGIVNLKTKELLPFSPKYVITSKIRTAYKQPATVPVDREGRTFDQWLESIAVGDEEIVTLLWQIILEAINPNYTRGKFAILYGTGNNGKGTYQAMLTNLIGADRVGALKPSQFAKEHDLETLVGKVCNIGDDVPNGHLRDTANLMSVTTGDTVYINPKGQKGYEASLKLFNLFSGNYIPSSGNKEEGWYRRILIVPFKADFNGQAEKPWIKNEFLADPQVLEYVLFKAVNQPAFTAFIEPQAVKDLLAEYREDNDYLLTWVKQEYMAKGWHELAVVPVFIATRSLKHWAEDMGIQKPKLYGMAKDTVKHLHQLTPHRYTVANGRVKTEDMDKLDPNEFDKRKLKGPHHSIKKE